VPLPLVPRSSTRRPRSSAGPRLGKTAITPQIIDPLPHDLAERLTRLSAALDEAIPARQLDRNLLVATWNVRAFGGVTEKWRSEPGDSPRRDLFDLRCIAEIVSRFDVVAIEEAREDLSALRLVLQAALEDPEAGVGRDPIEPGAERRTPVESAAASPRAKKRLLDRVLCILERAEHPVGVHPELAAIAFGELGEGILVAGNRSADDLLLRWFHRRRPLLSIAFWRRGRS
jgi:hypothetical protein